jgi:hypothetical protein
MEEATEYRGEAVQTEYLITTDIARELLSKGYKVKVECLNHQLVNVLTYNKALGDLSDHLGSQRTDVAIVNELRVPFAIIEVKIRVRNLTDVEPDLNKMIRTIAMLENRFAKRVWGASVFQFDLEKSKARTEWEQFKADTQTFELGIQDQLSTYAQTQTAFDFTFHSLQEGDDGIERPEYETVTHDDGTEENVLEHDGHAIRYYAVLFIKKTTP